MKLIINNIGLFSICILLSILLGFFIEKLMNYFISLKEFKKYKDDDKFYYNVLDDFYYKK